MKNDKRGGVQTVPDDPFACAALRARVLAAWRSSPARFREDANAEEDLVRGGYRDRVLVELAQNAADAAARAGVEGRLSLRLTGQCLIASNTGAPLDSTAVESLSTLRASAKRAAPEATVGRFGVGFAAVLAVSDEPSVASTSGAVRWSLVEARAAVVAVRALADELARRGGHVPLLRLPMPADAEPERGYDTTVRLPLRDRTATDLVRRLLDDIDDALLLSLPALSEIVVEKDGVRRTVAGAARWHVVRRSGLLDPHLLADRPTEERGARSWSVAWARPLAGQPVPKTVHAPTATDEGLDLPALLIASFPLDPSRRHVAPGPLTDFLVRSAAGAYAELAGEVDQPLALVPGVAIVGTMDAALRREIVEAMAEAPLLQSADGTPVRPSDAVSVVGADEKLRAVLSEVLPALVDDHRALDRLGARRLSLADVVDLLADGRREPGWWRRLYDALQPVVAAGGADSLGALPVPLVDGRVVSGPRGLLLPCEPLPAGVEALGLRIVHPDAAHPMLLRVGAIEASAAGMLADPGVRLAVELAADEEEPGGVIEAVLSLVERADVQPGELPWLGDMPLPDRTGTIVAAADLVLPGSFLGEVADLSALDVPHESVLHRWAPSVLAAAGVLCEFVLQREEDVSLDALGGSDLPDVDDWIEHVLSMLPVRELPPLLSELVAVRDLDVVRDDAWPRVLREFASIPALRAAVLEPARLLLADGRSAEVTSYTAWWLRTNALIEGHPPSSYTVPQARELVGLYDVLDVAAVGDGLDSAFLAAIGVHGSLATLIAQPRGPATLLQRLVEPEVTVTSSQLADIYVALSNVDPATVRPPQQVRVRPGVVVPASEVVVVDQPHHLQIATAVAPLVVPLSVAADLADVLDVATSTEMLNDLMAAGGHRQPVPAVMAEWLGGRVESWQEHDALVIGGHEVEWWVNSDGMAHAATTEGVARALAWAAGRWNARLLIAAMLAAPDRSAELLAEAALDG